MLRNCYITAFTPLRGVVKALRRMKSIPCINRPK